MKTRILDTARELFFAKGYDDTSVNDIITRAGSSKGAFYHHFKSKEDLLDTISELIARDSMAAVRKIAEEKTDAVQKLNKIFSYSRQFKTSNKRLVRVFLDALYRPSNIQLLERMKTRGWRMIAPELSAILKQGMDEGAFDAENAEECISVLGDITFGLAKANAEYLLSGDDTKRGLEALIEKNHAYERAIEKILGAKPGSIRIIDRNFIESIKG